MNKRFSTLLAGILLAGSFGSTYAQLDATRAVELKDAQPGRAYYLAGTHYNTNDALQAFTLNGYEQGASINADKTAEEAQWIVETKKEAGIVYYSFKSIEGGQYLAFVKDNEKDAYVVAGKDDANNAEKSFRWFTLDGSGILKPAGLDLNLGLQSFDNGTNWVPALVKGHDLAGFYLTKQSIKLYEIYNNHVTAADLNSKFGEDYTLEFPETLDDMDVFEGVNAVAAGAGFYFVDNQGTEDKDDDEYVVLSNTRVANSELKDNAIGYRYERMTQKEFDAAKKDTKIDEANRVFYAESSYNLPENAYAIVQKDVKVKKGAVTGGFVTFGKVTNDETVRQLASVEYDIHSTLMGITIGKGTRVANTEVANAKRLVVNVTAKKANDKKTYALGLMTTFAGAHWYDKVSSADFDQPQGQWLVAKGTEDNTIKLINVQKTEFVEDNIKLYEAEGENTYKVLADNWDFETITLTKVEDYDYLGANGYYNAKSDVGQKFAFVTNGIYVNEGAADVDLYLKAGAAGGNATVVPHEGSEWELLRNEEADAVTAEYKYYDGEDWVEFKGTGDASKGILPADTVRLAYAYEIKSADLSLAGSWKMAANGLNFYLKENEDMYSIVYGANSSAYINDFACVTDLISSTATVKNLEGNSDFAKATPFEIIDLDAVPSLAADSKHMTFEATNSIGFIVSDENNSAVLAKEGAALWVDSVNAEGYATPKFFISYAGKMMTTADKLKEIAKAAYDNDEISTKEYNALVSDKNCEFEGVERIKFVDAERLAGEDTLVIAGEKVAGDAIADFKFKVTENEDGDYVLKTNGKTVYVINGNLVCSNTVEKAEAFVIEVTSTPTANEGIATSEVKVLAGNGNVTIAGAAGKKVVVSNILGQVVANTVVSSDNAVIAAPAGVVVVAVEGEAAVKAIVK
ncbi:DUF6383 domain-containing protein [Parabacteroides johnsonii]|uniref:DUF6383 domain-containing protein n=1 Tax=Parabacteroides johnsonii TaxID=387661 RepID=UPI0022E084BD|nr:DUF6383 domain-containing protein [Parabacteroides johnsonii]